MKDKAWLEFYDSNVNAEVELVSKTINELIEISARKNPNKKIIVSLGIQYTYRKVLKYINNFASSLAELGIKKGDRVCFLLPNLIHFPVVHFAILKIGAISVPINPLYKTYEIEKTLKICNPVLIITLQEFYPKLIDIQKNESFDLMVCGITDFSPLPIRIIYNLKKIANKSLVNICSTVFFRRLINQTAKLYEIPSVLSEDTAVLLPTGGNNGEFKLAELTHKNLTTNTFQIIEWMKNHRNEKDSILGALPFFHSFGLTLCLHLSFISNIKLITVPRFSAKKAVKEIKKHKICFFPGVPAMFSSICDLQKLNSKDLKSLLFGLSGGVELNCKLKEKFEKRTGINLIECYGLTESSPAAISNPLVSINKMNSIGLPLPSTHVRIIDPFSGNDVEAGEEGELLIRGPQVMKGYWNNLPDTAETIKEGWLHTGDKAKFDSENYFYITGRYKNLIIYCGFNVYPLEIEMVLKMHPSVKSAQVFGIKDYRFGELVNAVVNIDTDSDIKEKVLKDFCKLHLAGYKIPKHIEILKTK